MPFAWIASVEVSTPEPPSAKPKPITGVAVPTVEPSTGCVKKRKGGVVSAQDAGRHQRATRDAATPLAVENAPPT